MDCDSTKLSSSAKSSKNKQLGAPIQLIFYFISLYFFPLLSFLNELLSALELPDSLLAGPETS